MATKKPTKTTKKSAEAKAPAKTKKKVVAKPGEELQAASDKAETTPKKAKKASGVKIERRPLATKTYFAKTDEVPSNWRLVDATGQTLGRLSTYIANALMGKDKPQYTRHSDTGDFVVVINAEKVKLTGKKEEQKTYYWHTNYPGGIKSINVKDMRASHPERIIERAVYGMLPKGHMGRRWYKKLRVFAGSQHPHQAQQPKAVTLPQ